MMMPFAMWKHALKSGGGTTRAGCVVPALDA